MYAPEIISLRQFYATPLGNAARALIAKTIHSIWPHARGEAMLGIGYTAPYLEPYMPQAMRVVISMPAHQGAAYWPPADHNVVFLAHESELPLPEASMNRVLLAHSVENSEQLTGMLEEVWRVLTPGGRLLAIVPNRMGFWSRSSRTPFGYGRPFSMAQLRDLLTNHHFTLTGTRSALFTPPLAIGLVWRVASKIEILGKLLCAFFGGVLLIEAEKQVYASIKQPVMLRKPYRIIAPSTTPAMGMKG